MTRNSLEKNDYKSAMVASTMEQNHRSMDKDINDDSIITSHGRGDHGTINAIIKKQGAYLPHWTADNAIYAVTYRLADSLPVEIRVKLEQELEAYHRAFFLDPNNLNFEEKREYQHLKSEKIDQYLNSGLGECWLKHPEVALMISEDLLHFDNDRYKLHAYCIMPNHVHIIVEPIKNRKLSEIVRSWKSFTAHEANRILNRKGRFWLDEFYDHIIRDEVDYQNQLNYLWQNPDKAHISVPRWKKE